MEKIFYKQTLIAVRIRSFAHGSNPITEASESLQVMTIKRTPQEMVRPHFHVPHKRTTSYLQECLIVRRGKVKVNLYGSDKKFFKKLYLKTGDALVLLSGGHGVEYLKSTEIFELKNGPFIADKKFI